MDLVLLSADFFAAKAKARVTGQPFTMPLPTRNRLNQIARALERQNLPEDRCFVIGGAKVPIIKFVDRVSGLKVDLSFNNDSGIVGNDTFQKWKSMYPMMPMIISVVKQYLMIRELNDNATGGLGGFSTICLVTSLIQHLPPTPGPPNLGRVLVEFFNLYGNLFNKNEVAIQMEPPAYIIKVCSFESLSIFS